MTANHLLELIERLGNLLRSEQRLLGKSHGLQPVHWQALDYLSRCNRMSDTPLALSHYLGISKGTASQSVLVLQNKGLITKQTDAHDRRVQHLTLTSQGQKLLDNHPDSRLLADSLSPDQQQSTLEALSTLLTRLIQQQGGKSFGVCHSCRYFQRRDGDYLCGLLDLPLTATDADKICHEHQYSDAVFS